MKKLLVPILLLIMFTPFYVNAESKYVYDVLKDEAESGGIAREYTGEHHDSFIEEPTKKIYHWYASNNNEGTAILDKNNVIFANHCWQMIRTTDTGGVKMIYNGEPENNQCLNTRGTHVGYASRTSQNLASNYWYGTDYTYDSTTKTFKVSGTTEQTTWNETTGSGLIGKYTCKLTSEDGSCTTLYLVESYYNTSSAYAIPLNSNSNYSQFGTLEFNKSSNSPTYVGYMYGDVYAYSSTNGTTSQSFTTTQTMLQSAVLLLDYWYADSVTYSVSGLYNLDNPYQVGSVSDYSNLVGKYTFLDKSKSISSPDVKYIAAVNNTTMYYKRLQSGNLLSAYDPIIFGDSITDNGDGTYTINNPTNVTLSDWYTNYATYVNKYTCNDSNTTCAAPRYITATTSTNYTYINAGEKIMIGKTRSGLTLTDTILVRKDELLINSRYYSDYKYTCNTDSATCTESTLRRITGYNTTGYIYIYAPNHYYGSSVTWDGTNYTLQDPIEIENYNNLNNISTHHYICPGYGDKTCETVAYVYYYTGSGTMYYITLKDGVTTVDKALEDMLTKNTTNSIIKSGVDAWYKHYLLEDYDEYIEDTIFCNDRSIRALAGWNPDGGMTNATLKFKEYNETSDLSCTNTTDQFSISNNNAKLTYKVGLMSSPEMNILNNNNARKTGQSYWLASPRHFGSNVDDARGRRVYTNGVMDYNFVSNYCGVRPAISLKPGTRYLSGNGSKDNPYVIDLTNYYSINVEINNETEGLNVEIDDLTQVAEGETVKFKVTPIKGHKVTSIKIIDAANNEIEYTTTDNKEFTFTMPSSNVTIIPSYERVKNAVNVEDNKNTKEFIIEVNDATAVVYEDTVRFKLEPESGYEVEDIDIIDEENNIIDYKKTNNINEYEFVMPDSNVLIKPKYRLIPTNSSNIINPNTGTRIYIIIIIMLVISSITYITIKRRKNYILN